MLHEKSDQSTSIRAFKPSHKWRGKLGTIEPHPQSLLTPFLWSNSIDDSLKLLMMVYQQSTTATRCYKCNTPFYKNHLCRLEGRIPIGIFLHRGQFQPPSGSIANGGRR